MRARHLAVAAAVASLGVSALVATSTDASPPKEGATRAHRADDRPGPLTKRQQARRQAALDLVRSGAAAPDANGVVALNAKGDKYVELTKTGTEPILTFLAEFGTQSVGKYGSAPGPLHNQIPQPNRADDNSTIWIPDFTPAHYEDLFFGAAPSFADFYRQQSSGAYTVTGDVSDWVRVPYNESYYGDNAIEDYGGSWRFIADTANAWFGAQATKGMTTDQINAYLATFDVWDRYDYDADGNFDEPDGYIDHFQAIHAGEGEDAGGGAQGEDAIWSHRWYVNATDFGKTGPTVGGVQVKFGGARIGNSNYWIGDYTTEPENGGLGVFTHEFGHDLGLPDLYDTAGGDNGTGFWTLMSAGSWMGDGTEDIGSKPSHMGPWEKLQLGWLDYAVVSPGQSGSFTLSPAAQQVRRQEQAVIVDVPDAQVSTTYNTPASGAAEWWSGSADDLNVSLQRSFDLTGVSKATLSANAWYEIEAGFDYLYVEYRPAGATDWIQIGSPIDGSTSGRWSTLRATVPGGGPVDVRLRYQTDGGVHLAGVFLDDIVLKNGGSTLFADDVEAGANGWVTDGWSIIGGTVVTSEDRYYLLEHRTYAGYDSTLKVGPYNFDKLVTKPNHVEHFPYQDGLLVWAVDGNYGDNNTSEHPGHGLVLPVDARPTPIRYPDGARLGNRRQPFDATFGVQATDAVSFHKEVLSGNKVTTLTAAVPSSPAIPTFSDAVVDAYWSSANPQGSALVAGHGVTVTVTGQTEGGSMTINVTNPA